jgi:hypothetical protein
MTLDEHVKLPRAKAFVQHLRPKLDEWGVPIPIKLDAVGAPIIDENVEVLGEETVHNVITTAGRDFLHTQGYGSSGLGANGLNYIALSNDTLTETSASTTLSNEIAANGLSRAQGTVNHTTGTNTTTVAKTFTCATAPQAAQKAALFTASSSGTMNHALAFTQRSLQIGDTLAITFTITLG